MKLQHFIPIFMLLASMKVLHAQTTECPTENYFPSPLTPIMETAPILPPEQGPTPPPPPPRPPVTLDHRGIYWVHGLGGDVRSWAQASAATTLGCDGCYRGEDFPARKAERILISYTDTRMDDAGLEMITNAVNFIPSVVPDEQFNFVIAHSQGGLVARMADKILAEDYDQGAPDVRNFYGIVTFGTPHGGARILNSYRDGRVNEFITDACKGLFTKIAFEVIDQSFNKFTKIFIREGVLGQNAVNAICDLTGNVLPFVLNDLTAGTTQDYYVGAPELNDLNGFDSPLLHRVAFAGIEYENDVDDDPVNPKQLVFRTLGSWQDNVNGPTFSKDDDGEIVEIANELVVYYEGKYDIHRQRVARHESRPFGTGWPNWKKYRDEVAKRDAFRDAYYFMRTADDQWKGIIGAYNPSVGVGDQGCWCQYMNEFEGWSQYSSNSAPSAQTPEGCAEYEPSDPNETAQCSWTYQYFGTRKPSDGIVTYESQSAFPGASQVNPMEETNHFQMRNSTPTADALMMLYSGDAGDDWFTTFIK
jgi:pimeloyl-ACP methyl ester carboxylesterase